MSKSRPLPLPPHYDPHHATVWQYGLDEQALFNAAAAWRREHNIAPAGNDEYDVHLLLVDVQKDFCLPEGALYVGGRSGTGAMDDCRRIAEFIYCNLASIKNVTTTLDTHVVFQIFFPSFWLDRDGAPLTAHRVISTTDVESGAVQPNPDVCWWLCNGDAAWLRRQVVYYCRELERAGKYQLYLWPPHCLLGSDGHALQGLIHEARLFHSYVRGTQSWVHEKGQDPLTENYSVLHPEVMTTCTGTRLAPVESPLLTTLLRADAVVVAGEAASHCVKSTVDDLLAAAAAHDPTFPSRLYLLTDCTSSVVVPDGSGSYLTDFTPEAEAAQRRFAEAGAHLVTSTDPIDSWLVL